MPNEINQRIRKIRKELRIKQKDVAAALGIKDSTYSQMERTGIITCETAIKLVKIFGTNLDFLLLGLESSIDIPPKKEETTPPPDEDKIILTPNEQSIITVLRHFSKQDREECIAFIERKYHNDL